jgi:phosphatidylserine/phosphatidylglycerophosphate/cardiolipin synthase-like enzyme
MAAALRSGQLTVPVSPFAVAKMTACPDALVADLVRLSAEGIASAHLAMMLDLAADVAEARMQTEIAAELVWSGPEAVVAHSRDTLVVIDQLFSLAERSILVSTYVVHQPGRVFAKLAQRLEGSPNLHARLFLHIGRALGDTRNETALLSDYAARLAAQWPGDGRRPEVYYDPRGMSGDPEVRASWHAKCVLVDDLVTLVTSANFTEWAQQRNVEAGALIRSRHFASQLRSQFDSLIASKQIRRLPGF